jgi:putative acetyltransferase
MFEVIIRNEIASDVAAIHDLTRRAFAPMAYAGGNEQDLIDALRACGALSLSLVAVTSSRVVGHVAFSSARAADGAPGWFALGPVSVEPEMQHRGIGQQLITAGLGQLRAWNASGCIVVGDPNYYQRFGFRLFPALAPAGMPPEYFMMLSLTASQPNAVVEFHSIFSAEEPNQR